MKLKIFENRYLLEDIAAVKKYYPNIDDATFMQLIALDPTYRDGSNSLGKYGKWILNLYNKGIIPEDDFDEITSLLNQFTIYRNRIANKDLNAYKTLDELSSALAEVVDDDSMLSDRQKLRFRKNVKAGRVSIAAEDDYDVVFEDDQYIVYVPNTHEASMKLGKGTQWCTAHENPDWYERYTRNGGKLYIIKNKRSGNRWQYSDSTGAFLDETDSKFDIEELVRTDAEFTKFKKFLYGLFGYKFNDSGEFIYSSSSDNVPAFIEKAVIADGVEKIGWDAFSGRTSLTSVTIPDSVTKIGHGAFSTCTSLTSITIPNSVTKIGRFAFYCCTGLTSITIPDSITVIEGFSFSRCTSLTTIIIPDSVTKIEEGAFSGCTNLTSITIPDSVTFIDSGAFRDCTGLTSITIPDSVTEMGYDVFQYCEKLIVYTDNSYMIDYCNDNNIPVRPAIEFVNESIRKPFRKLKLRIEEK